MIITFRTVLSNSTASTIQSTFLLVGMLLCHVRVLEWICSCLNVKELLARNRRDIWSLSVKLLCVFLPTKWLRVRISLLSFSSWYHEINHYHCHKWSLVDCNTRSVFFIKYTKEKYPVRYQKSRILICRIDCGFLLPLFNSLFQYLLFGILIANFDK